MLHQFWCFWAHEKRHISVSHGRAGRAKPQLLGRSEARSTTWRGLGRSLLCENLEINLTARSWARDGP